MSCGIEPDEVRIAGLRLTRRGSITTCAYAVDMDGRADLSTAGLNNLLGGKNLRDGQAVFVTIRYTPRHDLRMMIFIDFI